MSSSGACHSSRTSEDDVSAYLSDNPDFLEDYLQRNLGRSRRLRDMLVRRAADAEAENEDRRGENTISPMAKTVSGAHSGRRLYPLQSTADEEDEDGEKEEEERVDEEVYTAVEEASFRGVRRFSYLVKLTGR